MDKNKENKDKTPKKESSKKTVPADFMSPDPKDLSKNQLDIFDLGA